MAKFVASVNIPGYLPESDTPVFDTPAEAWRYLAEERERGEDDAYEPGDPEGFSETVDELKQRAEAVEGSELFGVGTVYGDTPGYDGNYDLGLVYRVSPVSDAEAAEIESLQY
jgi:hypothetical protein